MHILDQIKSYKEKEVAENKQLYPVKLLEKSIYFESLCVSMQSYLRRKDSSGIIAEFKRKSPSKGNINPYADPEKVSIEYMQAGAAALSVLTDAHFFGAKEGDLPTVRKFNYCPILRKDFIIDEYQIVASKSMGADVILLIAKLLSPTKIKALTKFAHELGLEVLLEIHEEEELNLNLDTEADLVGINNRNLDSFKVDTENSIRLSERLPSSKIKIAESGIDRPEVLNTFRENGFQGFLIGEYFMKNSRPGKQCRDFINQIQKSEV